MKSNCRIGELSEERKDGGTMEENRSQEREA